MWIRGVGLSQTHPLEELRAKGNTPDFILEHFIALCINGTAITPVRRSWNLTVMPFQHHYSQSCSKLSKNPAMNYNDQLTVITLCTVGVTLRLLQVLEFTVNEH